MPTAKRARRRKPRSQTMQATKEALLRAGVELFAEEGLDNPSLDAICARAGKTRGAFYVHFADRESFLEEVMSRAGSAVLDRMLGPRNAPANLGKIVAGFVEAVRRGEYVLAGDGGVKPHQLMDACARSPRLRDRYAQLVIDTLQRLGAAAREAQIAGLVRDDVGAGDIAALLFAGVLGAQTMLELKLPLDLPRVSAALMRLIMPPPPRF